ncbi:MAG: hypothetical protein Q7T99_18675 [Pseudomonas sp.]|nr:hypothetical protein [Pseudomonas sp.]
MAQVEDLIYKAETEASPTAFAANGAVGQQCIIVADKLKGQGFTLRSRQETLTTVANMARACDANELIVVGRTARRN